MAVQGQDMGHMSLFAGMNQTGKQPERVFCVLCRINR